MTNLEAWKLRSLEDFARGQSRRDVFAFRPLTCWFRHRLHLSPIDLRAAAGSAIVFAFRSLTCWFRHRLCLSPIDPRAAAGSAFVFAVRPLTCAPRMGPPSFSLFLRAADGSAIVFAFRPLACAPRLASPSFSPSSPRSGSIQLRMLLCAPRCARGRLQKASSAHSGFYSGDHSIPGTQPFDSRNSKVVEI